MWVDGSDLSWRKVRVLLEGLPPESHFATAMRVDNPGSGGGEHDVESEAWSRMEHLLAAIRDEVHLADVHFQQVNFKGKPKFEPMPRPGVRSKGKKKQPSKLAPEQNEFLFQYLQQMG